jgi:hypothetical protein
MTSRVQEHRYATTDTRPGATTRPPGELWLNFPDYRLGMIDPTQTAVDLLAIRTYAATSTYALGDYVVSAGQMLRAKTALTPHAFLAADWDIIPTQAFNDNRYTTQAQNDARYYTKAQSDANYYSRLYIDTSYYTRAQSDARYYTQAQSDGRYLQLTGGALSGELTVGGNGIYYTRTGSFNHAMAFGWDGGSPMIWVDNTFIGYLATQAYVTSTEANYLPLAGGTITGSLQVNGNLDTYGTLYNHNGRFITYAPSYAPSITLWKGDTGAMGFYYDGNINFGPADGAGGVSYAGRLMSNGSIEASNRVIGDQGVFASGGQDFGLYQSGIYRVLQFAGGWNWAWNTTNGDLFYGTPSSAAFIIYGNGNATVGGSLQVNANVNCSSTVTAAGTVQGSYVHSSGSMEADGSIAATANVYAVNSEMMMAAGGSGRIMQFAPSWFLDWNSGNGDLVWQRPGGQFWAMRTSDGICMDFGGPCAGVGAYVNFSDERAKTNIYPATHGLREVLRLNPVTFRRVDHERTELGFTAQDVEQVIPEAVRPLGVPLPDGRGELDSESPSLGVSIDPIVAALVNGMKELAQRLTILEANP